MRGAVLAALVAAAAAPAQAQEAHLLVVSGLGGEPAYADSLVRWGRALASAASASARVTWLAEDPSKDPRIDGPSRRDGVARALGGIAREAGPDDVVFVILMGHGSQDARGARLNLPGPDLGVEELADMLAPLKGRVAVVNTASASGAMVPALAAPGRVVVAATASGSERNQTWFGRFFADAYAGGGADTDKDGTVSLLEAFDFARLQVEELYSRSRQLQSEHPVLDDDGDGEPAREPTSSGGDGALAAGLYLAPPTAAVAAAPEGASPELAKLYEERAALAKQLEALQRRKASMEEAAYDREFEAIMVELALKNRAIRELEGQR